MITVKVIKENAKYKRITIIGHAMYDDYGKDIVCSACSSIVTTTVNGILSINNNNISYLASKKVMKIDVKSDDKITQTLINNMISLLKELSGNYPENIEIK